MAPAKVLSCSFCRKRQHEVRHLVTNDTETAAICDRCTEMAVDVVDRERKKAREKRLRTTGA
jgi:ATP-dependent protease Clp ATPase subunit